MQYSIAICSNDYIYIGTTVANYCLKDFASSEKFSHKEIQSKCMDQLDSKITISYIIDANFFIIFMTFQGGAKVISRAPMSLVAPTLLH